MVADLMKLSPSVVSSSYTHTDIIKTEGKLLKYVIFFE